MKKLLPILLFLSCAKPVLEMPEQRIGNLQIIIEQGENNCAMDLYVSLMVDGSVRKVANEVTPCYNFPLSRYKGLWAIDVNLRDVRLWVYGAKFYEQGVAEWEVWLKADTAVVGHYLYQVNGYQLTVTETRGKYYRQYTQNLKQ